jgi:K+-transporting ATPase A subunit
MTVIGWIQILLYCAIIVALVKPLGWYMTRVFNGERTFLSPVLQPVETALYWVGASTRDASNIGLPTRSPCCSSMSAGSSSFTA